MAIIRDRSLVKDWNNVPIPMIVSCIKEHQNTKSRFDELEAYYLGKHPILARSKNAQHGLPNNRLVANHAKYITDIAVGYMIGDPVKYEGTNFDEIKKVYDQIDIVSHDAELAKDLSIFGEGRELYYMTSDDVPIPKATALDPRQTFLVVDDTVEYKSLFGVHFYEKRDIDNAIVGYYVNVYSENTITQYETTDLNNNQTFKLLREPQTHYFGGVPIVEFWNNEERQGDYEQQISLIDAYNVLMSDRVNDKEQLVDALLAISGGATLGDTMSEATETAKKIKELKILELPLGADAKWLTKNLTESDVEVLRDAIREDIHQFAMVPNLTDENFAANASGVAMKYKLLGLEQLAKIKERYFIQGLRERLKLFANVLKVKGKAVDVSDVKITMTRNLPANDVEIANMISQLSSSVPNETLIGQLSFIDDPAEETKKLDAQKDAEAKRVKETYDMPFGDVKEDEETK